MKDIGTWQELKERLDSLETRPIFQERDIWFCHLGKNIGDEQNGSGKEYVRPVIIIKKFNAHICWIIPLTHSKKESVYYFRFSFISSEWSIAILSQLRLIDVRRLMRKIGFIPTNEISNLKEKLKALLP